MTEPHHSRDLRGNPNPPPPAGSFCLWPSQIVASESEFQSYHHLEVPAFPTKPPPISLQATVWHSWVWVGLEGNSERILVVKYQGRPVSSGFQLSEHPNMSLLNISYSRWNSITVATFNVYMILINPVCSSEQDEDPRRSSFLCVFRELASDHLFNRI